MEQLSIRADELVTIGLKTSVERRICFFIPESVVELRVNLTTITSHCTLRRLGRFLQVVPSQLPVGHHNDQPSRLGCALSGDTETQFFGKTIYHQVQLPVVTYWPPAT
jgi:hypothetical protein